MLQIIDNQITLTQGDTCSIEITFYTQDADVSSPESLQDEVYVMEEGDILKFVVLDVNSEGMSNNPYTDMFNQSISQNYRNLTKPPILIKEFTDNIIDIQPNDLKFVNTGTYLYGVVLVTKNGFVNTIQQGKLILKKGFL